MLKTQGLTPVTTEQGMNVAKKMNAQYMECSSKEMVGVDDIFNRAILTVVANDRKNLEASAGGPGARDGSNGSRTSMPGVGTPKRKKAKCRIL